MHLCWLSVKALGDAERNLSIKLTAKNAAGWNKILALNYHRAINVASSPSVDHKKPSKVAHVAA